MLCQIRDITFHATFHYSSKADDIFAPIYQKQTTLVHYILSSSGVSLHFADGHLRNDMAEVRNQHRQVKGHWSYGHDVGDKQISYNMVEWSLVTCLTNLMGGHQTA